VITVTFEKERIFESLAELEVISSNMHTGSNRAKIYSKLKSLVRHELADVKTGAFEANLSRG
jgi:hypothetical protein